MVDYEVGTIKRGPLGDVVIKSDIVPPAFPWYSVLHSIKRSDDQVKDWPVIGVVPCTPAARLMEETASANPALDITDEMVERAARAWYEAELVHARAPLSWDHYLNEVLIRPNYRGRARVALFAALKEG